MNHCSLLQGAIEQQSYGMRTRNGGVCYPRLVQDCQRKKGNKHITMPFLEQGGYFDVPIQVGTQEQTQRSLLLLHLLSFP